VRRDARPATCARVDVALPQHDRVALDVDAAPAGAAGELGVLPRRDVDVASPLYLTSFSSTTLRAGMLMPSASVSVANTTLTRPSTNPPRRPP
jgi:hypothetical protein